MTPPAPSDSLPDALSVLENVNLCPSHASDITPGDVAECIAVHRDDGKEYADTDGVALVLLKNGQYATLSEWGDASGHG